MKTVYTLTEHQFKAIESFANTLLRDDAPLSVARRKSIGEALQWMTQETAGTATMQVEPSDRKTWTGSDRRVVDRRNTDTGPIIRNIAVAIRTGKAA